MKTRIYREGAKSPARRIFALSLTELFHVLTHAYENEKAQDGFFASLEMTKWNMAVISNKVRDPSLVAFLAKDEDTKITKRRRKSRNLFSETSRASCSPSKWW